MAVETRTRQVTLHASLLLCLVCGFCALSPARAGWEVLTGEAHAHALPFLSVFFFDSEHGIAITPVNVQKTHDGGKQWAIQLEGEGKAFSSVAFTSPRVGFIAGLQEQRGAYVPMILRTDNGGESWQESLLGVAPRAKPNTTPLLHSISFCNEDVGWAAGADLIVQTTDGGRTWATRRAENPDESLFGVQCGSPDEAWAVGEGGLILHTADGGRSWRRQEGGTKATLFRVRSFGGSSWAVGADGTVLRTLDGGVRWESRRLDQDVILFDIHLDAQQGWLVGSEGAIWQTADGGQTWQRCKSPTDSDLLSLFFVSPRRWWASGGRRTLLRFSD